MFEIDKLYTRDSIGKILNTNATIGKWTTGCVGFNEDLYFFINIEEAGRTGHNYNDKFLEDGILEWHGRTGSHIRQPRIKKIINNETKMYLFVRTNNKLPFTYIGLGKCIAYFDEVPAKIHFDYEKRNLKSLDEKEIENIIEITNTEKETLIKSRIGHSKLKEDLLKNLKKCQLCNIKREELLIASHIKPWSKSTSKERLDINNVLLLCPQHDALFDKGFISFKDSGEIIFSDTLDENDLISLNLSKNLKLNLKQEQIKYLQYHRKYILKQK